MNNYELLIKDYPDNHKSGFVNIIGKPNAGKSTLMNALVGEQLAIITSKAQTTRHRIMGIVNGVDFQIVYSDTPGIIEPNYGMQKAMMKFVSVSLKDADVLLVLIDITDKKGIELFEHKIRKHNAPVIVILNKIDLMTQEEVETQLDYWKHYLPAQEYLPVSALKKVNLQTVFDKILTYLPLSPPYYPKEDLTDKPERFFVSEIIREKIFLNYHQEIPYSVEIAIESYKEATDIIRIRAIIFTNRKSQKPILIGKGGSQLKKVGTQARKDIEKFVDKKVFLELFVKVKENWRDNEQFLKYRGYE